MYLKSHLFLLLYLFYGIPAFSQQPAFPGAEGFGRFASGGRGGTVYHVTHLNDSGPGSFRDAVSQPGRTVVFDVAGVIRITEKIVAASKITIAGQTAPGTGITVYGNSISFSSNTIIRYIRFRGSTGMPRGGCTVIADDLQDLIFDHVSIEWGRWDNLHIKNSKRITLQYCLIGEGIDPQRFGALLENPVDITVHHCLWTGNQSRSPKAKARIEYLNNVVYNWGKSAFVGGHSATDHYQDLIGNYFIAGPSSSEEFLSMFTATDHVYHKDNYADLNRDGKVNGRLVTDADFVRQNATLVSRPSVIPGSNVVITPAGEAWKKVMSEAGCSLRRDAVDRRIIGYFRSLGRKGHIFRTEAEAGGQPEVRKRHSKLRDRDGDGIPDRRETANQTDPDDAADAAAISPTGYTHLENYINSLVR